MTHFMYVPFTGLGLHRGFRGNKWLKNRIRVFKQFVIPSLMNQSKREFILWVSWRPEERDNKLVKELGAHLAKLRGMTFVFTFGGLCFWDDKYPDEIAAQRLMRAFENTLPHLEEFVDGDTVLMTIQPSDDMYLSTAVEDIQTKFKEYRGTRAAGYPFGYIINLATKDIAEYNPDTVPPFFTIKFTREQFLDPRKHCEHTGPYKSHEYVRKHLPFSFLKGRGFVVGTHGSNISTVFEHPFKGRELTEAERDSVLIRTGTLHSDYVIIKRGMHLFLRRILNFLPFEKQIRQIYHNVKSKN